MKNAQWLPLPIIAETRDVRTVDVAEDPTVAANLMFDRNHPLAERVLSEQFGF